MLYFRVAGFVFGIESAKDSALLKRMGNYLPFAVDIPPSKPEGSRRAERPLFTISLDSQIEIPAAKPDKEHRYDLGPDRATLRMYPERYILSIETAQSPEGAAAASSPNCPSKNSMENATTTAAVPLSNPSAATHTEPYSNHPAAVPHSSPHAAPRVEPHAAPPAPSHAPSHAEPHTNHPTEPHTNHHAESPANPHANQSANPHTNHHAESAAGNLTFNLDCRLTAGTSGSGPEFTFFCDAAAKCTAPPRHILDHLLVQAFSFASAHRQTLLIHASTVVHDGQAVMFLAESGTGKSTHARLWLENIARTSLLNDDAPALRLTDGKATAFGTPWSGKTPCYKNEEYPLAAVRIRRAPFNRMEKLGGIPAFGALLPSCLPTLQQRDDMLDGVCATLSGLLASVPVFRLDCLPDPAAAILSASTLFPAD